MSAIPVAVHTLLEPAPGLAPVERAALSDGSAAAADDRRPWAGLRTMLSGVALLGEAILVAFMVPIIILAVGVPIALFLRVLLAIGHLV